MGIDEQSGRIIGGGAKKLLYAADTILKMGVGKSAKALTARNTYAAGQSSVPADANSSAPRAMRKMEFCSNSFAIMPGFRFPVAA